MAFDSFSALIAMEGHGPYVWTCYGAFFALLIALAWWSMRERRQVILSQQQRQQQAQRQEQAHQSDDLIEPRPGAAGFHRIHTTRQ